MSRLFTRKIEDFVCGQCGVHVTGNGYTNHCPKCLWSRHVDINPGDRAATCGGLMEPVDLIQKKGEWVVTHRCVVCGFSRPNKIVAEDDQDAVLGLSRQIAERATR